MLELGSRPVEWDTGRCSTLYRRLAITGLVPAVTRLLADRCRRRTSAGGRLIAAAWLWLYPAFHLPFASLLFLASFNLNLFLLLNDVLAATS